jgi:hypothetical protein
LCSACSSCPLLDPLLVGPLALPLRWLRGLRGLRGLCWVAGLVGLVVRLVWWFAVPPLSCSSVRPAGGAVVLCGSAGWPPSAGWSARSAARRPAGWPAGLVCLAGGPAGLWPGLLVRLAGRWSRLGELPECKTRLFRAVVVCWSGAAPQDPWNLSGPLGSVSLAAPGPAGVREARPVREAGGSCRSAGTRKPVRVVSPLDSLVGKPAGIGKTRKAPGP